MGTEATSLRGTFGARYLDYALQCTSAPEVYHRLVAYGLIAAAVRRRVWLDFAGGRLYPNLWFCLLGESGALHKSTTINLGVRILRGLGDDWIYPSDFSVQKLVRSMQARPQGTLVYREFRALADLLSRDYMAGAKSLLTDLYDCPPYLEQNTQEHGHIRVEEPCLNLWAASTLAWFQGKDTIADLGGGFLARFVWLPAYLSECAEEDPLPAGQEATARARDELSAELRNIAAAAGKMSLATGAAAVYRDWHVAHRSESKLREGWLTPFLVRYEVLALKLAMLDHLSHGWDAYQPITQAAIIEGASIVTALEQRLVACLEGEVAFSDHEARRLKVLKLIPNGGGEISQRDLLRGARLPLRDLRALLDLLLAEGRVKHRAAKLPTGGPPVTFWRREEGG